jgi:hypothetical protein
MDKYIGLDPEAPRVFGNFLKDRMDPSCSVIFPNNAPDFGMVRFRVGS